MSDSVTRVILNTRLDPGVQLNDTYEIDERIASGGMGEVYRGHNIQTGDPVAIKAILPELADQEAIFALFKKEATVLGRLHHDTIVRYYSFSRDPRLGRPYLAMEFVNGVSLADRMAAAPLTPDEVRKLFTSVAEGLAIAHGAGVIHRDLSPDNIILRDDNVGRPKIIDFGIARSANIGEGTLIGGGFAGKFNFVSPEQLGIHNREVDARSDIYSLGLVIAASLRGQPLDMGGSHADVIEKRTKVPDLSDIDETLRPLIEAMLQPNPDDRPGDAAMVCELLKASAPADQQAAAARGGIGGPTGVTGTPFQTQPGSRRAAPAMQTGTPFAWTDPTQVVTPRAAPATVLSPKPPPPASESPFGPAAAYPAASPIGPAAAPVAASAAQPVPARQKSGAGRFVMAGGLLVLLIGGAGGAYMSGLIGPGKDGENSLQPTVESPVEDAAKAETPVAKTEPPATDRLPDSTKPTAKTPAHEAIGQALEDVAKSGETAPAEPPVGEPPAPEQPAPDKPTTTVGGQEPADLPAPDTSDLSSTEPPAPAVPDQPPVEPDKETQVAAAGLTKMVDVGVSWLRGYDGGKCFFVAVTSVSDSTINIKGFGRDVAGFEKLYNAFRQTNGIDPELNGHLINEGQCAAADFLKNVQPRAMDNPRLVLTSDTLNTGDPLVAVVGNVGAKALDLLLVASDGVVYNLKNFAVTTVTGGNSTLEMRLDELRLDGESPEMIIALTSQSGFAVPKGKDHARAAALFPKLARQVEEMGGKVGVDFAYFRTSQ